MENNKQFDPFNGNNLTRIEDVLEFYRQRGCNSEYANKVYRKIIKKI